MRTLQRTTRRKACYAHVGWTGSIGDRVRMDRVTQWSAAHAHATRSVDVKYDLTYAGPSDPRFGADFLTDERSYDVVILHHLFAGWGSEEPHTRPAVAEHFCFGMSPRQSPAAWRARLRASGARRIFAFGTGTEVAADYLGSIRGYRRTRTSFGAIYERRR